MCGLLMYLIFLCIFFLMIRRPPRSTRTDTLFPYTTLFRSGSCPWMADFQCPERVVMRTSRGGSGQSDPQKGRSEEHTSELQSLMRISYAVFCLKKKKRPNITTHTINDIYVIHQQPRNTK